jgi:hypothetical protein
MTGFLPGRARLVCVAAATVLAALSSAAAEVPVIGDFVGTWTRTWPSGSCSVSMEIRADGTMTSVDGEHRTEALLSMTGGVDDQGFVAITRTQTHDNAGAACTSGPRSPESGLERSQARDRTPAKEVTSILPFAHGDAMALCRFANLGGCDDWYSRVPTLPHRARPRGKHDLGAAVERQFYALIPENPTSFELAPNRTPGTAAFPDQGAPGGFRSIACEHVVRFAVVGHGATGWVFIAASCRDVATIEPLARKLVSNEQGLALVNAPNISAADRLRYGLTMLDRVQPDGSSLLYMVDEARGVDATTLVRMAVHMDALRRRAIVLMGIDMETMTGPRPPFASNPLYQDPASIMQALVERLAKDPDAALQAP